MESMVKLFTSSCSTREVRRVDINKGEEEDHFEKCEYSGLT